MLRGVHLLVVCCKIEESYSTRQTQGLRARDVGKGCGQGLGAGAESKG